MPTTEEYDDELYKDIKRGDSLLYWNEHAKPMRALVVEVHDVRTLSLLPAPDFDVFNSTAEEREARIVAGGAIVERVPRFNRSTTDRRHTWCGVH